MGPTKNFCDNNNNNINNSNNNNNNNNNNTCIYMDTVLSIIMASKYYWACM